MSSKRIDKFNAVIISSLILSAFLVSITILIHDKPFEVPYGNYVIVGSYNNEIEKILFTEVARRYSEYFNATILNDVPDNLVNNLIIIAHGNNDGSRIFLQLNNSKRVEENSFSDIKSNRAIYMSCSIGIIRELDQDTEHFAYSQTDELDFYSGSYNTTNGKITDIIIEGWSIYFLDLIIAGSDWYEAEEIARLKVDGGFE